MDQIWLWVGFNLFVLAMLAVDLLVFHKEAHEVSLKEAAAWSLASLAWPKSVEAHDPVIHDPLERKPPDPVVSPPLESFPED